MQARGITEEIGNESELVAASEIVLKQLVLELQTYIQECLWPCADMEAFEELCSSFSQVCQGDVNRNKEIVKILCRIPKSLKQHCLQPFLGDEGDVDNMNMCQDLRNAQEHLTRMITEVRSAWVHHANCSDAFAQMPGA